MSLIYCISGLVSRISKQNVQIDEYASHSHRNKCLLQRFLTSTFVFWDTEGIHFNNKIFTCCYVRYMLKYALKSAVKH